MSFGPLSVGADTGQRSVKALCVAALLVFSTPLVAPAAEPLKIGDPSLRESKVPDSVPNISGVWQVRGYERQIKPADGSPTPFLPWNKEIFDKRAAAEKAGNPMFDPTAGCMPSGVPRIIAAPYPIEIVQTPDKTVFLFEVQHLVRIIHMNAKHPAKVEPSYMGHSIGHWEGDTLVIDTVGIIDGKQIDEAGTQHTKQLHVAERIRKVDEKSFEHVFTITDPGAFSQPWTARRMFFWRPEVRFIEYVCEENNRNAPDANGVLRNF
jgi:hypothetical protein